MSLHHFLSASCARSLDTDSPNALLAGAAHQRNRPPLRSAIDVRSLVPALLVGLLAVLGVSLTPPAAAQTFLDSIVVVVDDDVITQSELEAHLRAVRRDLRSANTPIPETEVLVRQGLESLIREKLLLREAERQRIFAREIDVDVALEQVANRNRISVSQLERALESEGLTVLEYRKTLSKQIRIQALIDRVMAGRVRVTDADVDLFLTAERNQNGAEEVDLQRILISLPDNANAADVDEATAEATSIIDKLAEGESFTTLAQTYSDGDEALQGGGLGWRKVNQLPSLYVQAVKALDAGGVSEVLRGPNGLHILKVADRRENAVRRVRQLNLKQILLTPNDVLSDDEALDRIRQLRARLVAGESFNDIARAHSVDPISRALGGDLGWVIVEELPPAIRRAVSTMQVGEVSEPIRTEQGYHLVRLDGDEDREVTDDIKRRQARQAITERKREDAYARYTRELRDEAYVEFRIAL